MLKRFFDNLIPPSHGTRFPALDGLRGLACMSVMFTHMPHTPAPLRLIVGLDARMAVCIFFILSAFLLFYPYAAGKPPAASNYYKRRFFRIFPAFVVALILSIVTTSLFKKPPVLGDIVTHFLLIHSWFYAWASSINQPTWSLCTEMQFYILLPLLALCFTRFKNKAFLAFFVIAITFQIILPDEADMGRPHLTWRRNLPYLFLPFVFGMLAAYIVANYKERLSRIAYLAPGGLLLTLGMSRFFYHPFAKSLWGDSGLMPMFINTRGFIGSLACAIAVVGLASSAGTSVKVFSSKPMRFIGILGYGIFLFHRPIRDIVMYFSDIPPIFIVPPIAMIVAFFCFRFIEKPFIALSRKVRSPLIEQSPLSTAPPLSSASRLTQD